MDLASDEPANRKVMRQFLTTPILIGTCLFVLGALRGYGSPRDFWRHPAQAVVFLATGLLFLGVVLWVVRRLFREMLDTKDRLSSVISSMADVLVVVDPQGAIGMVNQAALNQLRFGERELLGTPMQNILRRTGGDPLPLDELRGAALGESAGELEGLLLTKEGERIPVLLSSAQLRNSIGRITGTVCVARDIRERKKAAEEAQRIHFQLMQASKLASLGTIGSGVAHEIRNPLTLVKASAALIQSDSSATPFIKKEAKEIVRCAERMRRITEHLLTFSRERKKEEWKQVELEEAITNSLILLKTKLKNSDVKIRVSLPPDLPKIWGDSSQLESVFQNLLSNSLDAFEEVRGDRKKRISITGSIGEPGWIDVLYEDNASGMPPEVVERIFDPFFTTKAIGKGTGLGMSLVHGILKQHRSQLHVKSVPGQGTEFRIRFPIDRRSQAREEQTPIPLKRARKEASAAPRRKPTVLIVDDEASIAHVLKRTLSKTFNATVWSDPAKACEEIARKRFDLVVTDLQMPDVNGVKILAKVKECQPNTPVVIMTAYGEEDPKAKRAIQEGAAGIMDKPFPDPATVQKLLLGYLREPRNNRTKRAA